MRPSAAVAQAQWLSMAWMVVASCHRHATVANPTAGVRGAEAQARIKELCRTIRDSDQVVYNALDMTYKPSRNKTLLQRSLAEYNEALLALRKMAVDNKDEVLIQAKDLFDEGLPKYFRVVFAEYKLKDNLDMTSDEVENIYVYRGQAMGTWSDLHFELGIPW